MTTSDTSTPLLAYTAKAEYDNKRKRDGRHDDSSEERGRGKKLRCFYCGRTGHKALNCSKRRANMKSRTRPESEHVSVFMTTGTAREDDDKGYVDSSAAYAVRSENDVWYVDSGATQLQEGMAQRLH
jgi:hypothetical protein